ncbi:Agmatine deiminase [Stieleria maiorica]|uniref:Agmatine deiminase n=1 Tax=Stieleria maiorica TaxID=2795974 RepID=A0A5B9MSC1_9BACT|nr:agmatine deiminase family protein [Stieleria maiorica]QEG02855.1 Agmatine deiminase [Stieleria maiorica]
MKRVPAEWERQAAVWIAWPHNHDTWPDRFAPVPGCFRRMIELIAPAVPVHVIGAADLRPSAGLENLADVTWIDIPTNDSWIRDYGPTFVVDGTEQLAIDWGYNSWGGKYPPWDADNAATAQIIQHADWKRVEGGLTLEGGALEWDGSGRLLTTTECLVTETRNPGWTKPQVESQLQSLAGAREIVWVDGGGLIGDDTDGHIDQLARFIDPETVVVAVSDDPDDPNHAGLQRNERQLRQWAQSTSPQVTVHRLPIPPARFINDQRVPESYCNFLRLGPDRLLVPTFRSETHDSDAITLLSRLARQQSPAVEVIGVDCHDLIWGLGALHCASCNQPAMELE